MIWPGKAMCALNLGFDLDGETIWRNKARRLAEAGGGQDSGDFEGI